MAQPGGLSETRRRDKEQDNLLGGPGPGQGSARGNGAAGSAVRPVGRPTALRYVWIVEA